MAAIKDNHFSSSTHNLHSNIPQTRCLSASIDIDSTLAHQQENPPSPLWLPRIRPIFESDRRLLGYRGASTKAGPAQSSRVMRTPRTHDIARPRTQLYHDFTNDHYSCKRESESVALKTELGWHRGRLQIKAISVMISYRKRNFYVYSLSTANFFKSSKDTLSKAFSFVALRKILCMVRRWY